MYSHCWQDSVEVTDKDLEQIFDRVVSCPTITKLLKNGKTKDAAKGSMLLALLETDNLVLGKKLEQDKQTSKGGLDVD